MPADLRETPFWIFDVDNTLYSPHCSIFPQIHDRMEKYIMAHFSITQAEAAEKRRNYFYTYGTSLRGLMVEEKINPDAFLDYVHAIDYSVIERPLHLRENLEKLPGKKVMFTNADSRHGRRVLDRLGITDLFDVFFDIADSNYVGKPETAPYRQLLGRLGATADECTMIDDMESNLKPAAQLGMTTIWLRHEADWLRRKPGLPQDYPHCHYTIDDLPAFFQTLTDTGNDHDRDQQSRA